MLFQDFVASGNKEYENTPLALFWGMVEKFLRFAMPDFFLMIFTKICTKNLINDFISL